MASQKARDSQSRLSTTIPVAALLALIGLWSLFGWLSLSDRRATLSEVQDHLVDVASAYGEHASTLMQMGVPIRIEGMPDGQSKPGSAVAGEKALKQFRGALDLQNIQIRIRKDGAGPQPGQRDFEFGVPDEPDLYLRNGAVEVVI